MRLLTCIVTYNRIEYSKRCIESYLRTTESPYFLAVVDNGSTDGTREYLSELRDEHQIHLLAFTKRNLYPGAACNHGWHGALRGGYDATHLHRSDNDIEYLPGWNRHAKRIFQVFPELGELGVLNQDTENVPVVETTRGGVTINTAWPSIGGNAIIPRKLYEDGLRWEPGPWTAGANEDAKLSHEVKARGYLIGNMIPRLAVNIAYHRFEDYPDYYRETAAVRGLVAETSV